jgi:16S rRNA (guanine966-N2)-methyltransferase|uniref:16S rRNA (Guanine(966)-N(2))-methyltransferase RsmD n=1 Tax=candidate division WOR-3 bacterium TaxID=2052148 RepID=A0A7C4TDQ2_UNCW3
MRVITGSKKGKQLRVAKSGIRPTRGVVRSAIFNILNEKVVDAMVIDIFAGTGALGIEALSRGARYCIFVEKNPHSLLKNIDSLNLKEKAKIMKMDFRPALKKLTNQKFDIVFIDPPYRTSYLKETLKLIYCHNLLNIDSIVVAEQSKFNPCVIPEEYQVLKEKKYGDTIISFLKLKKE